LVAYVTLTGAQPLVEVRDPEVWGQGCGAGAQTCRRLKTWPAPHPLQPIVRPCHADV